MASQTLYIVGNGFDLWHGIPSEFSAFKEFVRSNDRDVYREVEDYLPVGKEWNELEQALAGLDADLLVENLGHYMGSYGAEDWSDSGHHDFQYEVEQVVERLTIELRSLFTHWVRGLSIPTRATAPRLISSLDTDAAFLNFNYTSTLSKVYGVPAQRIEFIHGCADLVHSELVLGHAWSPDSRRSLNDQADIEDLDTRLVEANDIIDGYFSTTFKPSSLLIAQRHEFFDGLTAVEKVVVLGHSLSSVDGAYFHALLGQVSIANAQWLIACRTMGEWGEVLQRAADLGVTPARAAPVLWSDLQVA